MMDYVLVNNTKRLEWWGGNNNPTHDSESVKQLKLDSHLPKKL